MGGGQDVKVDFIAPSEDGVRLKMLFCSRCFVKVVTNDVVMLKMLFWKVLYV